jgi:hypothetical protein
MRSFQAHQRLLCVTRDARGSVAVRTGAGAVSADFDASVMQQPPSVISVAPQSWSTTNDTLVEILGDKYAAACVGLCTGIARGTSGSPLVS